MGKVIARVKLTNVFDPARSVEVDAVVDTGATMLVLPTETIESLGLRKFRDVRVRYANNTKESKSIYGVVTLEIDGRGGHFDVLEESPGSTPLIGQIVLEALDLIVDSKARRLTVNPESPDVPLLEIL